MYVSSLSLSLCTLYMYGIADDCAAGLHHKSLRHTGAGFQAIERAFNSEIIAKGDRLAKTEIA